MPNGSAIEDACGVCNGDGSTCADCAGTPNGSATEDACGVCDGDGSTCADCAGVPNGSATEDACGVCNGDGSTCADCAGTPNGSAVVDQCGVCGGDDSTCADCAGMPNGSAVVDECGVCGGDGSTCTVCDADYSTVAGQEEQFLDECSATYPATAVDCFEGSIVIVWEGTPEQMEETKNIIKDAGGVDLPTWGFLTLKSDTGLTCTLGVDSHEIESGMCPIGEAMFKLCDKVQCINNDSCAFEDFGLDDYICS